MRMHINDVIGDYIVLGDLGPGSYAEAYKAKHNLNPDILALKLLNDNPSPETKDLFYRENEILKRLKPHIRIITPFSEVLTSGTSIYYVMECASTNLVEFHKQNQPLSDTEILRLFKQICEGLQHAHAKDVTHRDLHPRNILLKDEQGVYVVKLTDFGLAKDFTLSDLSSIPMNRWGNVYITPPEFWFRIWDKPLPVHYKPGDIYALGILLYFLYNKYAILHGTFTVGSAQTFIQNKNIDVYNDDVAIKKGAYEEWLSLLPSNFFDDLRISISNK